MERAEEYRCDVHEQRSPRVSSVRTGILFVVFAAVSLKPKNNSADLVIEIQ